MDNHVHLIIKADSDNMSTAMKRLNVKLLPNTTNRITQEFFDRYCRSAPKVIYKYFID